MDLFCVGLNHRNCPVEIRERLAFLSSQISLALHRLKEANGVKEAFILSTCNRVEIYARSSFSLEEDLVNFIARHHGLSKEVFRPYLYFLKDEAVVRHLFRVASGLESLVIGENEIYGQIRQAFRMSCEAKSVNSVLYQLIERALKIGKKVRAQTKISQGSVSVSSIAVELAQKIFGQLTKERVLVIGAGEMSELTLKHLVACGVSDITVASRSYERAAELATRFGATPIAFEEWATVLCKSDIVITSTSAPHCIIRVPDVKHAMALRGQKPLFFIDIAVPRDIDSDVAKMDDVYVYDIDDLQSISDGNLKLRWREVKKCDAIIEAEVENFHQWYEYLEAKPVVQKLNSYFDQIIDEELSRARKKFKGNEKELESLIERIKAKLLHMPLEKLKDSARSGTIEQYLVTLHSLFDLTDQDVQEWKADDQRSEKEDEVAC